MMKKKAFCVLLGCMLVLMMHAQDISKYEYWIDHRTDAIVQTTASGGDIDLSLDVSTLVEGLHSLTFRAQDTNGNWSAPLVTFFVHSQHGADNHVSNYEYWFDHDLTTKVSASTSDGVISIDADASSLADGLYSFTFRAQDTDGQWNAPLVQFFVKSRNGVADNKISAYQYWFNEDFEKATLITLEEPATPYVLDVQIPVDSLIRELTLENTTLIEDEEGNARYGKTNVLNIRFQDLNGDWNTIQSDLFTCYMDGETSVTSIVDDTQYVNYHDGIINICNASNSDCNIYDTSGKLIYQKKNVSDSENISVTRGNVYIVYIHLKNHVPVISKVMAQ